MQPYLTFIFTQLSQKREVKEEVSLSEAKKRQCASKFWIDTNGEKCIEIAYSKLSAKENEAIMKALDKNWDFINEQIDKTFSGIKTESKRIK